MTQQNDSELRLIPCPKCNTPREFIGTVNAEYSGNDPKNVQFAEMALRRGFKETWKVYECHNPDCGCGCRSYIVSDQTRPTIRL